MFCPLKKLQQGEKSMKMLMDSGKRTRGRWQLVQDDRWARHYTGDWLQKFSHSLGKWDCTFSLVFLVSVNIHTNTHSYQLTHRNIQEVNMCCLVLLALWIIIILASLCLVLFPFAYFISLGLLKTLFIAFVLRSYDFFRCILTFFLLTSICWRLVLMKVLTQHSEAAACGFLSARHPLCVLWMH